MADRAPPDRVRMALVEQPGRDEPVAAGPRRRRWVVVGAVVILAVVTAVAWSRGSDPVPVRVVEPISGSVQAVPDAPSGSIVGRGDRTLPRGHELVGLAVVDDVRELGARSGDVHQSFPHVGSPGGQRHASLEDDTWVVPTASGWDLVRSDGTVERHVDTDVRPEVTADQFLTASGSTVTARRRADGTAAWSSRLAHPVDALYATAGPGGPDRALLDELEDPPTADVAIVAHERTPRGADPRITGLTTEGRAVGLSDDPPRAQTPRLTVGDELVGLCVPVAERPDIGQPTCPDAVTLEAFDGSVLAGRGDLDLFRTLPAGMLATRPGVAVVGREELALLGWGDLATPWTVPNDGRGPIPAAVSATGSGVAVGWDQPVPATTAWYG